MQPETAPAQSPYVGLRPFERAERHLFFGHEREAGFISDKVFAARLTFLYAPSGMGKSSVLRTTIIPKLEEEGALPIYFDAWTSEDPVGELKEALAKLAATVGLPNARAGAPTLAELVRLISSVDGRTVVLVLDQFDELLNFHAGQLEAVRKELASLVRATNIDARVLISLREEFLAALESFRGEILNLFGSTYMLGPLDPRGLREAIEQPASAVGGALAPALTDVLIADLAAASKAARKGAEKAAEGPQGTVDLPMLQIVCSRLWEEAKRTGKREMTLELYRKLGGIRKILDRYVKDAMPRFGIQCVLAAMVMKRLAPRSGFKMSYSANDLADGSWMTPARLGPLLRKLEEKRILRARSYATGIRYELQHDAFIGLIEPWRDQVLKWFGLARSALLGLGAAAIIAAVAGSFGAAQYVKRRLDFIHQVQEPLAALRADQNADHVAEKLDQVGAYVVWKDRSEDTCRDAAWELSRSRELISKGDYGFPPLDETIKAGSDAEAPITVRYSAKWNLDPRRFAAQWKSEAQRATAARGLPVPARVRLIEEPSYPKLRVTVEVDGAEPLDLRIQDYDAGWVLVGWRPGSPPLSSGTAAALTSKKAEPAPEITDEEAEFVRVPRWSIPVWKAAHAQVLDRSSAAARMVVKDLLHEPDRLLTAAMFQRLMEGVKARAPETLAEASASRGKLLRQDLVELVSGGGDLRNLEGVLDALAGHAGKTSAEAAPLVKQELEAGSTLAPEASIARGKGPRAPKFEGHDDAHERAAEEILAEVQSWLPQTSPIRVAVGPGLVWQSIRGGGFRPQVKAAGEEAMQRLFQGYGVAAPAPDFAIDHSLREDEVRVEVLDEGSERQEATRVQPDGGREPRDYQEALAELLFKNMERRRAEWITAGFVTRQLSTMPAPTREWLDREYSVPELERMLRQVVGPAPGRGEPTADRTIRHTNWLLRSLVFWSAVEKKGSPRALAEHLAETQRARLGQEPAPASPPAAVAKLVREGIERLDDRDPAGARDAFAEALRRNPAAAQAAFLGAYRETYAAGLTASAKACRRAEVRLSADERADVADLLGRKDHPERHQGYLLCLFDDENGGDLLREKQAHRLLGGYRNPSTWAPADAWRVGSWVMRNDQDAAELELASKLMVSTFPWLSAGDAARRFREQVQVCQDHGWNEQCWALLQRLQDKRPAETAVAYARALSASRRPADLQEAVRLIDEVTDPYLESGEDLQCLRAEVHALRAAKLGGQLPKAERDLIQAQGQRKACPPGLTHLLASAVFATTKPQGAAKSALAVVLQKDKQGPREKDPDLWIDRLLFSSPAEAGEIASRFAKEAGEEKYRLSSAHEDTSAWTYGAALMAWLQRDPQKDSSWSTTMRQFLLTSHPQVPYVTMMLASGQDPENSGLIEEARGKMGQARLKDGDERAWRARLLECALDPSGWPALIQELDDAGRYQASDYARLRLPRDVLRTQAYFYKALSEGAKGGSPASQQDLKAVRDLKQYDTLEYKLANYLLPAEVVAVK